MNLFKRKEVDRMAMPAYSPTRLLTKQKSEPRVAYTITPEGWNPNDWGHFAKVGINARLNR